MNEQQPDTTHPNTAPAPTPTPALAPAPAPANLKTKSKTGWALLCFSIIATAVTLYFGYITPLTIIPSSFAGKNGLEAKNKPLAIIALVFTAIVLAAWAYSYIVSTLG